MIESELEDGEVAPDKIFLGGYPTLPSEPRGIKLIFEEHLSESQGQNLALAVFCAEFA